ncbi:MAG: chromosomal replication initiator protein DnaA [Anaerolineae bacterium]|nr:chromosomal replication initiator protein DnaA [Anaerolineae bacterium]
MKPKDAWKAAYNQLELQLDRASFDTWLRPAVLLSAEKGVFVVGVHNTYARDMLQHRLYRNIWRLLTDLTGQDVEIKFEIHKAETPSTSQDDSDSDAPPMFRFLAMKSRTPDLPETSAVSTSHETASSSLYDYVQAPQRADLPESELNARFTFDRFMVQSNQVVYEAALSVAEHTASLYNPFLIYGGVGLGKTHLLQAIAHVCQQKGLNTVYIPSEVFTNDLISAIRERSTAMFRDKYRTADVLLVDDIQFIGGKESTQEEFFHTFNALVNFNKQIVLASDRHPSELKTLEDRLRSRFQGGLVADIQPPSFETRIAIMKMWSEERGIRLPYSVLEMVSNRVPKNVRELEGAFNQVVAQTQFGRQNMSLPSVESTLNRYNSRRERVSMDDIIAVTAQNFGFTSADLRSKKRTAPH